MVGDSGISFLYQVPESLGKCWVNLKERLGGDEQRGEIGLI